VHRTRLGWLEKCLDQGGGVGGGWKTSSAPTVLSSTSIFSSTAAAASAEISRPGSAADRAVEALAAAAA